MELCSTTKDALKATAARLADMSLKKKNNPFLEIKWPDSLPEDVLWMPHELMTVYGTKAGNKLTDDELLRLSKWESIWFYSFNVHGERHLLQDVLNFIHAPGHDDISEYLHHFICEENNHSWFFSNFCTRYGGKVYEDKRIRFQSDSTSHEVSSFLTFARILILEETLDYYNVVIKECEYVPPIIQELNALHHSEEARHMAFGRSVVSDLFNTVNQRCTSVEVDYCKSYVSKYIKWCLDSLYYPYMYFDAEIHDAYRFRNSVMTDPARQIHHDAITSKVRKFFHKIGAM